MAQAAKMRSSRRADAWHPPEDRFPICCQIAAVVLFSAAVGFSVYLALSRPAGGFTLIGGRCADSQPECSVLLPPAPHPRGARPRGGAGLGVSRRVRPEP